MRREALNITPLPLDDTPIEEVKTGLRRALQQLKMGQTRPVSELWDRIDAE
jgi:hypothetical protein